MNNLYLLCGKPGCGKSTFAKRLNTEFGMIHLSADDFMLKLFGEIKDRKMFDEKLNACKNLIFELSKQLLVKNDVVLDFGFWTKKERSEVKSLFENSNVILLYLKLDDDTIFKQIEKRNANLKDNEYYMDKNTYEFLSSKFEEPISEENAIVVSKKTNIWSLINQNQGLSCGN